MITSHVTEIGGLKTRIAQAGSDGNRSLPLLLLHGWGASSDLMRPIMEPLCRKGYRVYAPDLPGFGETERPVDVWGVSDYAQWVSAVCAALELPRVGLIGHSFGGRISIVLGADHASKTAKIVLVDSAGVPTPPPTRTRIRLKGYQAVRSALEQIGARQSANRLRAWYGRRYGSADYQSAGEMRDIFVRVVNQDLLPLAARIAVPTLLIWGERDEDTPLWQAQRLEQIIPDAGLVTLAGAGHYSYLEQPGTFVTIVDHFFGTAS
jgi:pimeloyl-ACP methyl ester carboxylesterase